MELVLLLFVWVFLKLDKRMKQKAREKAMQESRLNSSLEYLYTWHYFWDEIVPVIYEEAEKRFKEKKIHAYEWDRFSPISECFKRIGEDLFQYSPAAYANILAKQKMISDGKKIYIPTWLKEGHVRDKWREERELKPYRKVTDSFCDRFPDDVMHNPEIQSLIPAVDDYRRTQYKTLDGQLIYHPDIQHVGRCGGRYGTNFKIDT